PSQRDFPPTLQLLTQGDWKPDKSLDVIGVDGDSYQLHLLTITEKEKAAARARPSGTPPPGVEVVIAGMFSRAPTAGGGKPRRHHCELPSSSCPGARGTPTTANWSSFSSRAGPGPSRRT